MDPVTDNKGFRISRAELDKWVASLIESATQVIAPVERRGVRAFRVLDSAQELCLADGKTQWSPKEFLFPRTESVFSYETLDGELKLSDPPPTSNDRVILGVRPCDASGLACTDAVLGPDAIYAQRRARTVIVALTCPVAEPECFCASVGGAPDGTDGSDVQLVPLADAFLVRSLTPRGEALIAAGSKKWKAATDKDWAAAKAQGERVAHDMRGTQVARDWAKSLEARFESPAWRGLSRSCVGCSICTYVCPSCTCFNVEDEGSAGCGSRCRSWDSCSYGLFTLHASGHNPRPDQASRYRQRVLHKFSYYPEAHGGKNMCVGCGRCAKHCPVGLDIHEAVHAVMSKEASHAG